METLLVMLVLLFICFVVSFLLGKSYAENEQNEKQKQVEAKANGVANSVGGMSDSDVADKLRDQWTRGDGK